MKAGNVKPARPVERPGRSGGLRFDLEGFCEHGFLLDRSPSDCPDCDQVPALTFKRITADLIEIISTYRDGTRVSLRLSPDGLSWTRSTLPAEPRSGSSSPKSSA